MAARGKTLFGKARIAVVAMTGLALHVARRLTLSPRARRVLRVGFLGAAALGTTFFIVSSVLTFSSSRQLQAELRKIEAAREPLAPVECAPPDVSQEENAAVLYKQAFALRVDPPQTEGDPVAEALDGLDDDHTGKIANRATLEKFLAQNAECFAKLEQGARRPACRFDVDYSLGLSTPLPHLVQIRTVCHYLRVRAQLEAEAGHPDEALATLEVAARVAHGLATEPCLISQLVRLAASKHATRGLEWVLSFSEPGEAACRAFIDTLEKTASPRDAYLKTLLCERSLGTNAFRAIRENPDGDDAKDLIESWAARRLLPGWVLAKDELAYLEIMNDAIERVRKNEGIEKGSIDERVESLPRLAFVTRALVPAIDKIPGRFREDEAARAVARVSLALRIHRLRAGSYPEKLDDLAPAVLASVPRDPFTGEALRYERAGAGFKVWSKGPNKKDDGGAMSTDRTTGTGPLGDDISFRVSR
ncbi:hypothetical protein HY251_16455 [bacterium]|nr:hypothetical protein [bacterium]